VIVETIGEEAKSSGKLLIVVGVLAYLWVGLVPFQPFVFAVTLVIVGTGVLLIKNTKLGIICNFALPILVACFFFWNGWPAKWWHWIVIVGVLFSFWGDWANFMPILKGTKTWDDFADGEIGEGKSDSLISIVLLQRQPRSLDPVILKETLSEAWGGSFDDESEDQFVTGEDPVHFVRNQQGMWLIHNHPEPYDDPVEMANSIPELRLKTAVAEHRAWLSVDLMVPGNEDLPLDTFYPYIFRLIKDLANDDTLVIYRPESGSLNIWDREVAASLGSEDPLQSFSRPSNPSVFAVQEDDPRMLAAVKEARDYFHVFRDHWAGRKEGQYFAVKAKITRDEITEYIWIEVTGLEPDYVHGTLGNEPVNLAGLKLGSQVEVPFSDLKDWTVMIDEETPPLGLYTVKVVQDAQSQS
jgi:uncharacterized protein YegJ (DUF2314 family)